MQIDLLLKICLLCIIQSKANAGIWKTQFDPGAENATGSDILGYLANYAKTALRTVFDRVIPSIANQLSSSGSFGDVSQGINQGLASGWAAFIPNPLVGQGLINCPRCQEFDDTKLAGNWRLIYASDNFVKYHMEAMMRMSIRYDVVNGQTQATNPNPTSVGSTLQEVLTPIRLPVCVRWQIGQPPSGLTPSIYQLQYAFKSGTIQSPLRIGYGTIQKTAEGSFIMALGGGRYAIRFCLMSSNLDQLSNTTASNQNPPQQPTEPVTTVPIPTTTAGPPAAQPTTAPGVTTTVPPAVTTTVSPALTTTAPHVTTTAPVGLTTTAPPALQFDANVTLNESNPREALLRNRLLNPDLFEFPILFDNGDRTKRRSARSAKNGIKRDTANTTQPLYMILSESSDGVACKNFLVLANDELQYFQQYDANVMQQLNLLYADNDLNPLQYIGCPCGFTPF